ncbi:hypothetical protein Nepgr_021448 [Nepenthes gracilis]|uniref:Uncharacterized protein n=1 Tax=Nepenthes gracilis TaxID=150966 RepID=A0AAD3T015_NEPGR|nr:hypothetical protein Nepgr_021448 [Nepenthes gracilis]
MAASWLFLAWRPSDGGGGRLFADSYETLFLVSPASSESSSMVEPCRSSFDLDLTGVSAEAMSAPDASVWVSDSVWDSSQAMASLLPSPSIDWGSSMAGMDQSLRPPDLCQELFFVVNSNSMSCCNVGALYHGIGASPWMRAPQEDDIGVSIHALEPMFPGDAVVGWGLLLLLEVLDVDLVDALD